MRNIAQSRCFLIVSIAIVGNIAQDIKFNLDSFLHNVFHNPYTDILKDPVTKVRDQVTSGVADVIFSANGISKLNKKKLTLNTVNNEPGFSLTKEEMEKFKIWDKGVIPFFLDEYSFDKVLRDRIRLILDVVNAATGVQFTEIPSPPIDEKERFVIFINRRGVLPCVDYTTSNFTNQGVQKVVLGYDCINVNSGMGSVILTLLGVPPQHNAPNREDYIEIMDKNVLPDKLSYFKKLQNSDWLFHDLEYDFESASHYPYYMYSAHGATTIRPKWHVDEIIPVGENKALSINDILKVKMLYSYIMKQSNNRMHAACSHIFHPGKAFSPHQYHSDDLGPYRDKPSKYLGTDPFQHLNDEYDNGDEDTYTDTNKEQNRTKSRKRNLKNLVSG